MKKGLLIFLGVIVFLIVVLAAIPFLFKDKIKAKLDAELAKSVNAQVNYDADKFSLSLLRNFPNATIGIDDFSIIGKQQEFKGDTLFAASSMKMVADVMSVISGDRIKVKSIYLKDPVIATIIAKNGKMSWDLAIAGPEDTTGKAEEPSQFNVALESWEIENGLIIYEDQTLPMYAQLQHVDHKGSGDLTQEVFDLKSTTKSPLATVIFDGVKYLDNYALDAELNMNINYANSIYKFLENKVRINDFAMGFDGSIAMRGEDIIYDITYEAKETEFKNLISLVPAIYTKDYKDLKTEGKLAFNGLVKGTQNEKSLPGFTLNLKVNDAMMKYPSLPSAIKDINTDISIVNKDGVIDNTVIDVKKFHMTMDQNPVDARVLVDGLNPYKIDADVAAKVKLDDVTKFYPIEGTTLKGLFSLKVKAKGVYSDSLKLMPTVDAKMALTNGYVKTADFPSALEKLNFNASVLSSGEMSSSTATLENFSMVMDGEPFQAKALVQNFDDPAYDVNIKGVLDLTKLTKIYPLEDMTVAGRIAADITTKGVLSDVEAGRYDQTATGGTMDVKDLKYISKDFPQGMSLSAASFALTPDKMSINKMIGHVGTSDINVSGYFSNYMGYMFGKQDTVIRGNMTFRSSKFNVNEWMTEDEATTAPTSQPDTGVVEIPKNVDFFLASQIGEVVYDNMNMKNMKGNVILKDGVAKLENLTFDMLGGNFLTNGTYSTRDISKPNFDFSLKMDNILIKEAFNTFNTVKTFAPIAKNTDGRMSTNLTLSSVLDKEMNPVYNTMSGAGVLSILDAQVKGNNVLAGISKLTQAKGLDPMVLKNILIKFRIEDGKLKAEPFDVSAGGMKMNIGGSTDFTGGIDYLVKMDVPAGAIGGAANNAISAITGGAPSGNQNVKLDLKVGGTASDPKVSLAGSSLGDQVKDQVKDAVENKVKEQINSNADVQKAKAEAEKAQRDAEAKMKAEQERIRQEAEAKKKAEEERLRQEAEKAAKDKLKNLPKLPKF